MKQETQKEDHSERVSTTKFRISELSICGTGWWTCTQATTNKDLELHTRQKET